MQLNDCTLYAILRDSPFRYITALSSSRSTANCQPSTAVGNVQGLIPLRLNQREPSNQYFIGSTNRFLDTGGSRTTKDISCLYDLHCAGPTAGCRVIWAGHWANHFIDFTFLQEFPIPLWMFVKNLKEVPGSQQTELRIGNGLAKVM